MYCYILPILQFNGLNLFMVTLFLKILRVYHIFHNRQLKDLGWQYSNNFLIIVNIALTAVPNIFFIFWYSLDEKVLKEDLQLTSGNSARYDVIQTCHSNINEHYGLLILVPYMYLIFFALGNILLAIGTTKTYRNFKDTKKINFLIVMMLVASVCVGVILGLVSVEENILHRYLISAITSYLYLVIMVGLICIFILIPKLWWMRKCFFERWQTFITQPSIKK